MATKKNSLADTMRPSMSAGKKKVTVEDTLRPGTSELSRRTTVYFTEETAKELKIAAIEDGTRTCWSIAAVNRGNRDNVKTLTL